MSCRYNADGSYVCDNFTNIVEHFEAPKQCYGAKATNDCETCKDVMMAFAATERKQLMMDPSKMTQCTNCKVILDALKVSKLNYDTTQIAHCTKTVIGNNGLISCDRYCQGIGGKAWNSELPDEWKGAKCYDTNSTAAGCFGVLGKPINCKCVMTGTGWKK